MVQYIKQQINKNNSKDFTCFLFFIGFSFLVTICFFGSLFNCIYFLVNFERNSQLLFLSRGLFIVSIVFYFIIPNFGFNVVSLITLPFFQNYCSKLEKIINNTMQKNPLGSFLFFQGLLCFTSLHLVMICFTGIDLTLEYIYQLFNLVKLCFFPLVIYLYVITQLPTHWYTLWDNLTDPDKIEKLKDLAKNVLVSLSETNKKYPKMTKTTAGAGLVLSSMLIHGSQTEMQAQKLVEITGIQSKEINPEAIANNPKLREAFIDILSNETALTEGKLVIASQDILRVLKREKLLITEYRDNVIKTAILEKDTLGQLALQQSAIKEAERLSVEGSRAASVIVSSANSRSPSNSLEAHPSSVPSLPKIESSSGIQLKNQSKQDDSIIPSILEWCIF